MKKFIVTAVTAAVVDLVSAAAVQAQEQDPAAATETSAPADVSPATSPAADAPATAEAPATAAPLDVIPLPESKPEPEAATTEEQPHGSRVEEVIVTAQRREQRAQDVPISITVLDPQQIANANITNSSDLATYTPSLSTNQRFGSDSATFAIRGFTQDLRTTASVAVYFAEVVAPRGQSSQTSGDGAGPGTLFDLENVQVLKGPQGTLFGRNTTGGAVLIVPKKPTDAFEGYVETSTGYLDAKRVQSVVNVPVTDSFKMRFGVDYNNHQGYLSNAASTLEGQTESASELGDTDYTAVRASAVWNITDSLENYTIATYVDSHNHGNTSALYDCNTNPNPTTNPFYAFVGIPCQQQLAAQKSASRDGFYDIVSNIATPESVIKEGRFINTTTYQINDDLRFKNIAAYSHLHTENGSDIFGTNFHFAGDPDTLKPAAQQTHQFKIGISVPSPGEPVTSQQTVVEEIQLQGQSSDKALQYQTGAYFEDSLPDGYSGNNSIALVSCNLKTIEGPPSGFDCFDPLGGALGGVLVQQFKTKYLNTAAYAESSYDFSEHWSATLGARYTYDRTEGYGIKTRYTYLLSVPNPAGPSVSTLSPEVSSDAITGQAQVSYKPTHDIMTYAKYVRGYRQGNVILAADPGIDTFKPEHVNSYEIGTKTTFGGPVPGRFNAAVFYNDLIDQQLQYGYVSPTSQTTTTIISAGKSRIAGAEVEAFVSPFRDATLGISYSYLNTKLLKVDDDTAEVTAAGAIPGTATPIAIKGDTLPFAADHNVVTSLTYTLPLDSEIGNVDVGTTYVYTGKRRSSATGSSPDAVLQPFELLNLNVNWTEIYHSSFDLSMFGTNVLNEKYMTYGSGTYYTLGYDSRQVGVPRTVGARIRYSFGGTR